MNFITPVNLKRKIVAPLLFFLFSSLTLRAEEAPSLNEALRACMDELTAKISAGKIAAVLNFQSEYKNVSEYIVDELTKHIVNDGSFKAVERQNLDAIQTEMEYHLSGEVGDETAQSIGKRLGAEVMIFGSFSALGRQYRLIIRAISVETAEILAIQTVMIRRDALLATLVRSGKYAPESGTAREYKRVYLGARLGVPVHFYHINTNFDVEPKPFAFIDGGIQASVYLTDIFALQTEFIFQNDKIEAESVGVSLAMPSFYIPILAKAAYRRSPFVFNAFAGPFLTVPFGKMNVKYNGRNHAYKAAISAGILAGVSAGMKTGPGLLFIDARFGGDLGYTAANNAEQYQRSILSFSLGYEFGFIDR
jgi:hypothetical protein